MTPRSARALLGWGLAAELVYVALSVFVGHASIGVIVGGVLAVGFGWGLIVLAVFIRAR